MQRVWACCLCQLLLMVLQLCCCSCQVSGQLLHSTVLLRHCTCMRRMSRLQLCQLTGQQGMLRCGLLRCAALRAVQCLHLTHKACHILLGCLASLGCPSHLASQPADLCLQPCHGSNRCSSSSCLQGTWASSRLALHISLQLCQRLLRLCQALRQGRQLSCRHACRAAMLSSCSCHGGGSSRCSRSEGIHLAPQGRKLRLCLLLPLSTGRLCFLMPGRKIGQPCRQLANLPALRSAAAVQAVHPGGSSLPPSCRGAQRRQLAAHLPNLPPQGFQLQRRAGRQCGGGGRRGRDGQRVAGEAGWVTAGVGRGHGHRLDEAAFALGQRRRNEVWVARADAHAQQGVRRRARLQRWRVVGWERECGARKGMPGQADVCTLRRFRRVPGGGGGGFGGGAPSWWA